jgi:hypothetical protein
MTLLGFRLLVLILLLASDSSAQFESKDQQWFCSSVESVEPCGGVPNSVDYFNNDRVYPVLQKLLQKDFFKFYKVGLHINRHYLNSQVNMQRPCPLWADDRECSSRECGIEYCDDEVPAALRVPQKSMVRFVSSSKGSIGVNRTGKEVVVTNSSDLNPSTNSHLSTKCSPTTSSTTNTQCNSFKQAEKDQSCNTGNQFDPIDTSLTEGEEAQLDVMDYFEDTSNKFCDVEGRFLRSY